LLDAIYLIKFKQALSIDMTYEEVNRLVKAYSEKSLSLEERKKVEGQLQSDPGFAREWQLCYSEQRARNGIQTFVDLETNSTKGKTWFASLLGTALLLGSFSARLGTAEPKEGIRQDDHLDFGKPKAR